MKKNYYILLALLLTIFSGSAMGQVMHLSGQSIQPIYEGFDRNADGSFTMWFGYLNRNYNETPNVPIGENNLFQVADGVRTAGPLDPGLILNNAGPVDRGQPAYFYPRRQQFVFGVQVSADFFGKELVWSVTHNGETRTAVGTLEQGNIWNIDEGVWSANRGRGTGGRVDVEYTNQPPAVRIVGVEGQVNTVVGQPVTLRAFASDDGIPGPRESQRPRTEMSRLPNNLPQVGGGINRNSPKSQSIVNFVSADETGLAVTWIKYRGPGEVQFDNAVTSLELSGQEAVTAASFSQSGTYVLRAYADDSTYTRHAEVTVVVR